MDEKPWLGNEYYEVLRTAGRLNTALPEEAAAIDRGEIDSHGIGHRRAAELEQALDAFGATSYARGQAYEANAQWAQLPRLKAAEARADRLAAALRVCYDVANNDALSVHGVRRIVNGQYRAALADSPKEFRPIAEAFAEVERRMEHGESWSQSADSPKGENDG